MSQVPIRLDTVRCLLALAPSGGGGPCDSAVNPATARSDCVGPELPVLSSDFATSSLSQYVLQRARS